jgi:Cft2 family RNA processing exonuclease
LNRIRIYRCGGVVLEIGEKIFLLDVWGSCDKKFDAIFISHAHLDHISGLRKHLERLNVPLYISRESFKIAREVGEIPNGYNNVNFVSPGEELELDNIIISFHNSGHVIGGIMVKFEISDISLAYTGDFNYESSCVLEKADVLDSDILILDTTYGHPSYSFPSRSFLYDKIKEILLEIVENDKIPVLHGYALGKGQELTNIASRFLKKEIGVDKRVGFFNKLYERYTNRSLGNYLIGGNGSALVKGISNRRRRNDKHVHIIFTGWAMTNTFNTELSVPLSAHTGFIKLLDYVIENSPSKIYTLFGFEEYFAKFIKKDIKIDAIPLPRHPSDFEFSKRNKGKKHSTLHDFFG